MLYDPHGRPIDETQITQPNSGISLFDTVADRSDADASRALTPEKIDAIMMAANRGDTSEQCRLAMELDEKNWDITHAVQTRRNAVRGVPWTIEPADDSPLAKKIAEAFKKALDNAGDGNELDSFKDLIADLTGAILPGFAASEIIWMNGGEIAGFRNIEQKHFTFRDESRTPRLLIDNEPDGIALPYAKMIYHNHRARSGDPARAGLIRPLAWIHVFENIDAKYLLRFIERYAQPFLVAKVDNQSFDNERVKLKSLIRSFGPDGGGLFTRNTELELLQAANNTGDVYFKLLEYMGAAATKVLLGQTATAGDGGGWSNDNAQAQVRQDILESDCDAIAASIRSGIAAPWTLFNHGQDAPVPVFKFHYEPPEDLKQTAEVVKVLYDGGLETDEKEMSEKFGMKLTRKKTEPSQPPQPQKSDAALSADSGAKNPVIRDLASFAIMALAAEGDDNDEMSVLAKNAVREFRKSGIAEQRFDKLQKLIDKAAGDPDTRAASAAIANLAKEDPELLDLMDDGNMAELMENTIFAAAAAGKADKVGALKNKERATP